jgi:hypothetical protein
MIDNWFDRRAQRQERKRRELQAELDAEEELFEQSIGIRKTHESPRDLRRKHRKKWGVE